MVGLFVGETWEEAGDSDTEKLAFLSRGNWFSPHLTATQDDWLRQDLWAFYGALALP